MDQETSGDSTRHKKFPRGSKKNPWYAIPGQMIDGKVIVQHCFMLFCKDGIWKTTNREDIPKDAVIKVTTSY
jgi:hypothetical protein